MTNTSRPKISLIKAVRLIVARKVLEKRHPAIATEREVHALRGVATTAEDIAQAADTITTRQTFYENYYTIKSDG